MLRFLFNGEGRIGRLAYLVGFVAVSLATEVLPLLWLRGAAVSNPALDLAAIDAQLKAGDIASVVNNAAQVDPSTVAGLWLFVLIPMLVGLWSTVALTAKRLHDVDGPGWLAIGVLIFGPLMAAVLVFWPGQQGPNRYGPARA